MENQTRFNLSEAIENWRQELAAEPNLTPLVRNELETHLRDTIAEFQKRGLNDEESFWLARRRVGHPQPLGQEFLKANPAAIWRKRIMWMAIAMLIVFLWEKTSNIISYYAMVHSPVPELQWQNFYMLFSILLNTVVILVVVSFLLQRKGQILSKMLLLFQSRSRFLAAAMGWLLLILVCLIYRSRGGWPESRSPWLGWAYIFLWPLALIVLIAWLMGPEQGGAKRGHRHRTFLLGLLVILPALVVLGAGCLPAFKNSILIKSLLCLQLPYLLALRNRRMLNHETLVNLRGSIIVWNLILGALLTTPEIFTQLIMAAALQMIYELSVMVVFRHEQTQNAHLE